MSLTELQIGSLVQRYTRERDRFDKMAATVTRHLSARLRAAAVPHVPTFRSKDPESFRGKLSRDGTRHEFQAFEQEFSPAILDLAGVRMMLYRPGDVKPTCASIEELFAVPSDERFRRDHTHPHGYQAWHRVVTLRDDHIESDPSLANLRGVPCEVQVVTVSDHVWNELEHDIIYKTHHGRPTEVQDALLKTLRSQLDGVRDTVNLLMEATDKQRAENLAVIQVPEDLRQALKIRCGRTFAGDFDRLLQLLSSVLRELTPAALHKLPLGPADLDRAQSLLDKAGHRATADDLSVVVAALWSLYDLDFIEVVKSWPGKPGPISRLVRTLNRATTGSKV